MRLIGMMDSPYVRRVAVSLRMMDLPFTHEPVSVFRHYDAFAAINPVVKAPTLVTDDGVVLMDSTLILEHAERLVPAERRLSPAEPDRHARAQRVVGLALVACEKTVQIVYERDLRPPEKQHQPWIDRVHGQLLEAYRLLEAEVGTGESWLSGERPLQPDVTAAVAWSFTRHMLSDLVPQDGHRGLATLAARAESLPAFAAAPMV
ncbi:glutathione S-transferase [Azospirillum sp. ST 5-10]|uniref:glutathione S-transferase n=1 Tax=unclassified Azospirillum TaxID=2630922 RepID=UPI003F4A39F2